MAFGAYATVVTLAFSMLWISYVLAGTGTWAKRYPILLFFLGLVIAVFGVLLIDTVKGFEWAISEACKRNAALSDCASSRHYAEMVEKLVELGCAAVGAGVVALSIDVRSSIAFDREEARIEGQEVRLAKSLEAWRFDFDKLEQELDSISRADRVQRFEALRSKLIDLNLDALDITEEREALKPWRPGRLLEVPTLDSIRRRRLSRRSGTASSS